VVLVTADTSLSVKPRIHQGLIATSTSRITGPLTVATRYRSYIYGCPFVF